MKGLMTNTIKQWFTLIESISFEDDRTNDNTKFIAATKSEILYLKDIRDEKETYSTRYDILVVVDTEKKLLEYPKHFIGSYEYESNDEIFNFKNKQLKKIFSDLVKFNIISNDYKLKEYQKSYISNVKSLSIDEDIVFYHGTTESYINDIQRFGLRPMDTITSRNRENSSTIYNYTKRNVYLTPNKILAMQYANSQAKFRNDIPVLCVVTIPDKHKLLPDDDYIREQIKLTVKNFFVDELGKEYSEKPYVLFLLDRDILNKVLTDETTFLYDELKKTLAEKLINIVHEKYKKLCSSLPEKSIISKWNSVAYRGRIPSVFIEIQKMKSINESKNKLKILNKFEKMLVEN